MIYSFCHLSYQIGQVPIQPSPIYESFRGEETASANFCMPVKLVDALTIPEDMPIFQNIQGLRVVRKGAIEYRYYQHFLTGEVRELLIDNGDLKELYVLTLPEDRRMTELELINCLAFEKIMYEHGRFILHASFVKTPQGAILFTAPSGTGKSTQADLWAKYRQADIINGDRSGIWKEGDIWMAGGVPWCGTSGIMKNEILPIRAIVILKQGPENEMVAMPFHTKMRMILEQLTVNPWNQQMLADAQVFTATLCKEVPVLCLSCRPDAGAVDVLEQALEVYDGK